MICISGFGIFLIGLEIDVLPDISASNEPGGVIAAVKH